jgi:polysaccharide biosynthesis protein PslG
VVPPKFRIATLDCRTLRRLLAPLLLAALLVPAAAAHARQVPRGWLGVSFGPEYISKRTGLTGELKRMRRAGVETARFAVYWSQMQPDAGRAPDFRSLDRIVTAAARARLPLQPVVLAAPRWASAHPNRAIDAPDDPADFAAFMTALVKRYGSSGAFFAHHKKVRNFPIRAWQIWNEVSNPYYWNAGYAYAYPALLKAAYDAVKTADPGALVIESGLNSGAGRSWEALGRIYSQLDAQGLGRPFDEVAVHVYTKSVADALKVVRETRAVTKRHGDGKRPIRVTELAWPASRGKLRDKKGHKREFFAATTDKGMAKRLGKGVRLIARHRKALRISGLDWFQWASSYSGRDDAFRYSGLRRVKGRRIVDKPAMHAFTSVARHLRGSG